MSLLDSPPNYVPLGGEGHGQDQAVVVDGVPDELPDEVDQVGGGRVPPPHTQQSASVEGDQVGGAPVLRKRVAPDPVAGPSGGRGTVRPKRSRRIPTPDPPTEAEVDENDPYFRKKVSCEAQNLEQCYYSKFLTRQFLGPRAITATSSP